MKLKRSSNGIIAVGSKLNPNKIHNSKFFERTYFDTLQNKNVIQKLVYFAKFVFQK